MYNQTCRLTSISLRTWGHSKVGTVVYAQENNWACIKKKKIVEHGFVFLFKPEKEIKNEKDFEPNQITTQLHSCKMQIASPMHATCWHNLKYP